MTLTPSEIAGIAERAAKATEGPWLYRPRNIDDWGDVRAGADGYHVAIARDGDGVMGDRKAMDEHRKHGTDPYEPNGQFIAHARTDTPALLAHVAAQAAEIARLKEGECVVDVDVVARAIWMASRPIRVGGIILSWNAMLDEYREQWRVYARAAIAAMIATGGRA